jgi:pimeloyl-ACP methyl ester carboxylesterase
MIDSESKPVSNSLEEIKEKLSRAKNSTDRFHITKTELKKITNPKKRTDVEVILSLLENSLLEEDNIILLVHGIRDRGNWQESIKQQLSSYSDIFVVPIGYGDYFDIFQFAFSRINEKKLMEKIASEIRSVSADYPMGKITIVCHSFGTYLVTKIIENNADIRCSKLILCGSIISSSYGWNKLPNIPRDMVLNEVGTKDFWPIYAQFINSKFGATGTYGFKTHKVTDRFHLIDHGGFFQDQFIQENWIPILTTNSSINFDTGVIGAEPPYCLKVLNKKSFKFLLSVVLSLLLATYYFCT